MAKKANKAGKKGKTARKPLSTHPAFPFIVGLWFASLLGIGSLMVPVVVVEAALSGSGLAAMVPQLAPPLGLTARLLIALVCTFGGGLLGWIIARKVAAAHRAPAADRASHDGPNVRRPISAHDELGEEGLDGSTARGRRPLTVADEAEPSELLAPSTRKRGNPTPALSPVVEPEPEPDAEIALADLAHAELETPAYGVQADAEDEPLELSEMLEEPAEAQLPHHATIQPEAVNPGFASLSDQPAERDNTMSDRQMFTLPTAQAEPDHAPIPVAYDPASEVETEEADLHFSPPSLARAAAVPAPLPFEPEAPVEQPVAQAMPAAPEPAPAPAPRADWNTAEPDDLGLVQLAQRLGSSIARRREWREEQARLEAAAAEAAAKAEAAGAAAEAAAAAVAAAAAYAAAQTPAPMAAPAVLAEPSEDFAVAQADEAARAMAAYFSAPPVVAADPAPEPAAEPAAEPAPEPAPLPFAAPASFAIPQAFAAPEVQAAPESESEPVPAPAPQPVAFSAPVQDGRQMFQPPAPTPAPPSPLTHLAKVDIGYDEDEEAEGEGDFAQLAASFSLPLGQQAFAAPAQATPVPEPVAEREADAAAEEDPDFASLLSLRNPFHQRGPAFVRIEDEPQGTDEAIEPAVVFPGVREIGSAAAPQAASFAAPAANLAATPTATQDFSAPATPRADAEEHERALRDALLNLQRMSGTG